MTDISEHPDGCMCETCKQFRQEEQMKELHPEWYRELKNIRGQDSEPDTNIQSIPDGITEREARMEGRIR